MFTKQINGLTLTNRVADSVFPNITSMNDGNYDKSFLATLRVIMHSRVGEERVQLRVHEPFYYYNDINTVRAVHCIESFIYGTDFNQESGVISVCSFQGDERTSTLACQKLDEGFIDKFPNFTALEDVAKWLSQHGKIDGRVYIDETKHNVAIFAHHLNMKQWHLLQSLIPRYFPWYFVDKPLSEKETALLKSLTNRYAPDYESLVIEFTSQFDFRTSEIRNALKGFETRFEQKALQQVRRELDNNERYTHDLEEQFKTLFKERENLIIREIGLTEKIRRGGDGEDSELLEYFLCNKGLHIVGVNGGCIDFIVTTTLSNYDPDLFDSTIARKGDSFFYREYDTGNRYQNEEFTDDRIERLMKAVFSTELLKIKVCAAYRLNFDNGEYMGFRGYYFPEDIKAEYTPNQHIQHYACLGNNQPVIRNAMRNRDYVGAVSACCSSATNINMSEANTGTFFMQQILSRNPGKIILMPDGSSMTPIDAVKWLEAQDVKETNNEETN